MKGLEMPVNTLVVIAIAVLVMLGLVAMYMAGVGPFTVVNEMIAKGTACNQLTAGNCDVSLNTISFDYGEYETLSEFCVGKYKIQYGKDIGQNDENLIAYCKSVQCGCPGINFDVAEGEIPIGQ